MTQAAISTPQGKGRGSLPYPAALRARAKPAPKLATTRSKAEVKAQTAHVDRLKAGRDVSARLSDHDSPALFIFKRLDDELRAAESIMSGDPLVRACANSKGDRFKVCEHVSMTRHRHIARARGHDP